jgi:hypothetical protein
MIWDASITGIETTLFSIIALPDADRRSQTSTERGVAMCESATQKNLGDDDAVTAFKQSGWAGWAESGGPVVSVSAVSGRSGARGAAERFPFESCGWRRRYM